MQNALEFGFADYAFAFAAVDGYGERVVEVDYA